MSEYIQYEKIGDTEIILDNVPMATPTESYIWLDDYYDFELGTTEIKDGYFMFSISPLLSAMPTMISSMNMLRDANDKVSSIKDTYVHFKTRDVYNINENEKENHDLAYELIVASINNFNRKFLRKNSTFVMGRDYKIPTLDFCLPKIRDSYRTV